MKDYSIKVILTFTKVYKSLFILGEGYTISKYTDEEFKDKVRDKIGNVRLFKKHLRKMSLIGNRQQFSEEHVQMFQEIREYKRKHHATWEIAFKDSLNFIAKQSPTLRSLNATNYEVLNSDTNSILNEILKTLQRIEEKL